VITKEAYDYSDQEYWTLDSSLETVNPAGVHHDSPAVRITSLLPTAKSRATHGMWRSLVTEIVFAGLLSGVFVYRPGLTPRFASAAEK